MRNYALSGLGLCALWAPLALAQEPALRVQVDASDAPRHILHSRLQLAVRPGRLTLVYPKWIPGEHGPNGPITDVVSLQFAAEGKTLSWERDPEDMFAFHVEVPGGTTTLEAAFDLLMPDASGPYTSGASASAKLVVVSWNQVVLYPRGTKASELTCGASLRLPEGWKFGTALAVASQALPQVQFSPVTLERLVDSPVIAGAHFKTFELTPGAQPAHFIDAAADSAAALEVKPETLRHFTRLVAETGALFGARHYESYHFLVSLSDHVTHFGLEHHESSDDRVAERSLVNEDRKKMLAGLLPHEMTHSWNGKYRRPAGLATATYQEPMKGELLWVYEGLTQYLGEILTARSGLQSPEEYREVLAITAATMDLQAGRSWRPLADTAVDAQHLYEARADWAAWRRGVDFYPESSLLWLEADTLIRKLTQGKKSLDDFCRAFFGGASGAPAVVPYTFDDVVAALAKVAPYDWAGFWKTRVETIQPRAPQGGIEASGWKLVYTAALPDQTRAADEANGTTDERYAIGILVRGEGEIPDVIPTLAAAKAGVPPGSRLVAVNGRRYSRDVLRDAIRASASGGTLELLVEQGGFYTTYRLDYTGGLRYPRLEREASKPDVLSTILAARATAKPAK
jgi:predicted metalloprotease with PDZ domain